MLALKAVLRAAQRATAPSPKTICACAKRVSLKAKPGGECYESCAACSAVRALTCLSNPAVGCRAPTSAATTSAGACSMRVSLFNKKGGRGHACT